MYSLTRSLTTAQIDQLVSQISDQGYAVMENAIDAEFLRALSEEIKRLEEVRPGGDIAPAAFTGWHTRRWFDLLNDGDIWQQVAIHPWVLPVIQRVLGANFLLSTMGTAMIGPGEEAQMIHTDDSVYMLPRPHPNLVCNTMWALSDFSVETGATRIIPGSNNWPDDPQMPPSEKLDSIGLEMPAGSIAFVVGTCYHGAGANISEQIRAGLTINYCNGRMRQQENLMLGVRPERMMEFPETLQDILGFKICQGAGHIFASDPREELLRRYGFKTDKFANGSTQMPSVDPYMARRNQFHAQRLASRK